MGKRNLHMIEELLERYFEGETSAAEEKQIRAFFASGEVPEHLAAYAPLFAYFDEEIERDAEAQVGEPDFVHWRSKRCRKWPLLPMITSRRWIRMRQTAE